MFTTTRYNPFHAASSAAFAELTSDRAMSYYKLRAQQDTQTVISVTVTAIAQFAIACQYIYGLGIQARHWLDQAESQAQQTERLALPPAFVEIPDYWTMKFDIFEEEIIEPIPTFALPQQCAPHPDWDRALRQSIKTAMVKSHESGWAVEGIDVLIPPAAIKPTAVAPKRRRGWKPKTAVA